VTGTIMLVEISLGFLMRTIPQINILSIGFGLKILVGISVLALAANGSAEAISEYVEEVMRGLLLWSDDPTGGAPNA
ncbi:MAG: flagellar biosynthetic protein FliR, partial [Planctomycetota bacterium]